MRNIQNLLCQKLRGLHDDETGAIMLEFIIILPLLCFLLFFIFFIQHIQHYQANAGWRYRVLSWESTIPTLLASGQSSSDHGFIRNPVAAAPALSGHYAFFALERYSSQVTPYQRLLPLDNHEMGRFKDKAMPKNPWGKNLATFARHFGGTTAWSDPNGLPESNDDIWRERFAMTVDPWQRNFDKFDELAIFSNPFAGAVGYFMLTYTSFNGRMGSDAVSLIKADDTENGETRENQLSFADKALLTAITQ